MRTRHALSTRSARAAVACLAVVGLLPALLATGPAGAQVASARAVDPSAALQSFPDCGALLAHLKEVALAHVGPYGFGGSGIGVFQAVGGSLAFTDAEGSTGSAPSASGDQGTFSTTNNQEVGVDEADSAKSDGKRLVTLRNGLLTVIDVRNPAKPVRRSGLQVVPADYGSDGSLLLQGDRVLALVPRWTPFAPGPTPLIGVSGQPLTDLAMISIADPAHPKVLDRVTLDGTVVAARLVGGSARVVVDSIPLNLAFVSPQSSRSAAAALATNRQIIQESTIADWLPQLQRGSSTSAAVDCTDVQTPSQFAGVGMTTIHTIAMGDRLAPASISLQADATTAYASTGKLYVTASAWVDPATYDDPKVWEQLSTSFRTAVHEFDISGAKAGYVASGEVRGHPINQWALSEQAGNLRIATTDGPTWNRPDGTDGPVSQSFMTVLAPRGGVLTQLGQVGGIGKGEQIRAVRYDGTTAYVVTFRQVDPFFVLDLSKPTRPTVVGQLKVAGYSGYLHPVGAGRVLGVGSDADATGRITGTRVSLFDVSDLRHPRQLSSWTLANTQTLVEFESKAFLFWAPTGLAVIPTQNWGPFNTTGAVGLRVTSRSITPVGFISHDSIGAKGSTPCRPFTLPELQQTAPRLIGLVVVDCKPGLAVTVHGFNCSPYSVAAINEQYSAHLRIAADHRIGVCTLGGRQPVNRSFVVGSRLLTLSDAMLLSSDLRTLAPGAYLDL